MSRNSAWRFWPIWLAVLPLSIWALVRTFGLDGDSYLAPAMALTPYAAIAALLLLGVCVALRNWAAAIVTAIACACLAAAVLPRAFGSGEETPPNATSLDVLSANLYFGKAEPGALLALVRRYRPDVLAVQELTPGLARRLENSDIEHWLPYSVLALPTKGLGRGFYSRMPLRRLPEEDSSPTAMPPVAARLASNQIVRLIDVHPHSPQPGRVDRWMDALERLPSGDAAGAPWLLVGDFNATLDQAAMRNLLDRGYRDAGETTGMSLEPTWPADKTVPPLITIDHVLADHRIGIASYKVEDLPGSDHRAIYASLFLR